MPSSPSSNKSSSCRRMWKECCCDLVNPNLYRSILAEFAGTFILVVIGCGTCLGKDWESYNPTIVQISLAFGLAVATAVWIFGHVSGGHINPAVTVAMLVTGKINIFRALAYIIVQCAGATLGSIFLAGLTPKDFQGSLGMTSIDTTISTTEGFAVEIFITFVLVMTIFAACDSKRNDLAGSKAMAIGLSVTLCHLFAIKYTGACMNPARSFGPALVMKSWTHDYWVYWAGPLTGGLIAGLMYEFVMAADSSLTKMKNFVRRNPSQADNVVINIDDSVNKEEGHELMTIRRPADVV